MSTWISRVKDNLLGYKEESLDSPRFLAYLLGFSVLVALSLILTSPWRTLAVIGGLGAVAVGFTRPRLLVLFLAVYTPFEPFLLKFVPDELYLYARYGSESLIYLLLAVVAARVILGGQRRVVTPLDLPFIGFLVVAAASLVINSVDLTFGLLGLRQIIRFMLLFFAVVQLDFGPKFIKRLTAMLLAVMVFQAGLGVFQAVMGGSVDEFLIPSERKFYESIQLTSGTDQFWSPGTRVFATMGRYDQLGTFLCFFMLIAVGLYYVRRGTNEPESKKLWFMAACSGPALILTMSRASWFGFLLGLFLIGALVMKDWRVKFVYGAAILAAILYLSWSGLVVRYLIDTPEQTTVERLFEAFSYERWRGEYYGLGRLYWMVQTPLKVVPYSPVLGVGPGQYGAGAAAALGNTRIYDKLGLPFGVYGSEGYIDNNWFAIWGETGTLGLFFYGWMVWALALIGWRTYRSAKSAFLRGLSLGYVGAVLAVTFQAFLATYLEVRTLALYLWLFGALIYSWARRDKIFG